MNKIVKKQAAFFTVYRTPFLLSANKGKKKPLLKRRKTAAGKASIIGFHNNKP
jgi:hypothetical protein